MLAEVVTQFITDHDKPESRETTQRGIAGLTRTIHGQHDNDHH